MVRLHRSTILREWRTTAFKPKPKNLAAAALANTQAQPKDESELSDDEQYFVKRHEIDYEHFDEPDLEITEVKINNSSVLHSSHCASYDFFKNIKTQPEHKDITFDPVLHKFKIPFDSKL